MPPVRAWSFRNRSLPEGVANGIAASSVVATMGQSSPSISVVVPTRNRPDQAGPCVASILENPDDFELLVVDQSDDDSTESALAEYRGDPRFGYHRSSARGAANARNTGVDRTHAANIAFTDDDCRVSPDWLSNLRQVLDSAPEAGIVFGRVTLPDNIEVGGFAAEFEPHDRVYASRLPGPDVSWGIGANMAVRRAVFEKVGMLDPLLGPGARFPAAEETDFMVRVIAAGFQVVNAKEPSVVHLGIRSGADASKLARGYAVALGAAFTKHLRLRTQPGAGLLLDWLAHYTRHGVKNAITGKRPTGLGFVLGMLKGSARSLRVPVDKDRAIFRL